MPPAAPARLEPRGPPGRRSAKARAFKSQIVRLYAEGHSCEAIRQALADIGVLVSESTVRRELADYRASIRHADVRALPAAGR